MTQEYKYEKLHEVYKDALLSNVEARMIKQDLTKDNINMFKGFLEAKINNVGWLLGADYIGDWRSQTGDTLDVSLFFVFRIARQIPETDIILSDEEFIMLGNFAALSATANLSKFKNILEGISIFPELFVTTTRQKGNNILFFFQKEGIDLGNVFLFVKYFNLLPHSIGTIILFKEVDFNKNILLMPDGEMDYSKEQNWNFQHRQLDGTKDEGNSIRL